MPANDLYATPSMVTNPGDCYFCHTVDIPGYGHIAGEWDLRKGIDKGAPHAFPSQILSSGSMAYTRSARSCLNLRRPFEHLPPCDEMIEQYEHLTASAWHARCAAAYDEPAAGIAW